MNIYIFWSILGLSNIAAAHGTEKHEKRHLVYPHYAARHHRFFRDNDKEETVTPKYAQVVNNKAIGDYDSLNLMFNSAEKMLGFANVSENVGFAFLHCKVGTTTLLLNSKSGTLIRYKLSNEISIIKKKEFKGEIVETFNKILQNYEYKNESITGDSSQIETSSEEGKDLIGDIYTHLGRPSVKGDRRYRSFKFVSKLVKKLDSWYFGALNGLLEGMGPLPLKQNLNRFFSISLGMKKMFARAVGGLKAIVKKVKFDVNPIYNGKNGAEVFVYILRQAGAKFNLGTLWSSLLNDIGEVLKIIKLLGGGENKNAVDETFNMIGHIWDFLSGRESLPTLVKFLLETSSEENWAKGDENDFRNVVKDIKNITDEQSKKYDNSGLITPFVTFTSNLTANSVIKNGVNISDFVEKWRKRDIVGGLKFVTDVVMKLSSPDVYSTLLFDSFTAFLNSSSDPTALKRLIPGMSVENLISGDGSLWEKIRDKYEVDEQLAKNGNATEILKKVPAFSELSGIYKQSVGKSLNFTEILKGSTITHHLSKLVTGPTKWTIDIVSNLVHDSGSFIKHIFWDPWKPLIPGLKHITEVINIRPTTSKQDNSNVVVSETTKPCGDDCEEEAPVTKKADEKTTKKIVDEIFPKNDEEKTTKKSEEETTKTSDDDNSTKKEEETITKKDGCDDCEKKESKGTTKSEEESTTESEKTKKTDEKDCDDCSKKSTTEKECDDCSKKSTTEKECDDCSKKSTTEKKCDDCSKNSTTEKECDDCSKKSTTEKECDDCSKKSTTEKDCDDCSKKSNTKKEVIEVVTVEYKRHNKDHYGVKHHNNHQTRHAHNNRHQVKVHHHQLKNHQKARQNSGHEQKLMYVRRSGEHKREEKIFHRQHRINSNPERNFDSYSLNGF